MTSRAGPDDCFLAYARAMRAAQPRQRGAIAAPLSGQAICSCKAIRPPPRATVAILLDALQNGQDIGHYGRLTFAMVARQFMDTEEIVRLLRQDKDMDETKARALVQQAEERILEWQAKQDFPIIPDPSDPSAGNVYRDLELPDEVYEHIEAYHEQRVGEHA